MSRLQTRSKLTFTALVASAGAVAFLQPANVVAQQKSLVLDEITVTAQRRSQSLVEVPLAIEVFTGNEIRRQGFRDLDDLANFSPTVLIEPRVQDQDVAIRGFGTTGNTLTHDQAAPFFVDGIHFGRQSQVKLAFLDVDSLEVLKGPQPVYFGQNATAGAFNIRSRRPTDTWEGYVNAEFASDSTNELSFGIGGPINDRWGIRVAGSHETTDGYLNYVVTGDPIGAYENNGGRVMLQFRPNDKLTITGKIEATRIRKDGEAFYTCLTGDSMRFGRDGGYANPGEGPGDEISVLAQGAGLGTPWGQALAAELDNYTKNGCFQTNNATSQGGPYFDAPLRTSELTDYRFDLPPEVTGIRQYSGDGGFVDMRAAADAFAKSSGNNGILGYEDLDGVNTFIDVEYAFDNEMSLQWLSGTSSYERDYAIDNRDGPFFTNFQGRGEDFKQWSTEFRLRSAPGKTVEWEAGAFFQRTDLNAFSSSLRANLRDSQRFNSIFEDVEFTGIFANLTFNVSDQFSIDIGGRQQDVTKDTGVKGYAASWIFAVCPEEPCDPGLTPVSVVSDLNGDYAGCEGFVPDGRGRDGRDVYCLVDPLTARLFQPVPDGAQLYAMPWRATRYVPLAWNAGYATPVGLTAPNYNARVARGEGPYIERFTGSGFSPQVALRFRATDNISIYARYAEAFKIGGFDTGQSSIPTSIEELTFQTEDAEQIELGVKGTLMDGRFSFDADIFELDFPNLQVSVLSSDPNQTSATGNAGQRVRGFEFNTRFAATENLVLGFAGAFMDGVMTRFPGAGCTDAEIGAALTDPSAPCEFFDGDTLEQVFEPSVGDIGDLLSIIDRTDLKAPRTPDWKFILDADYNMPFGSKYELNINAKGFISDGYIVDVEGFEEIVRYDQHEDLNIMVGVRNLEAGWTIAAFARNLLEARPTYHPEFDAFPVGRVSQFLGPQAFTSYGVKFEYLFD